MRKYIKFIAEIVVISILLNGCSSPLDNLLVNGEKNELNFPESSNKFGEAVAKEIRERVNALNTKGVSYTKANGSQEFKNRFYSDFYSSQTEQVKNDFSVKDLQINSEDFAKKNRGTNRYSNSIRISYNKRVQ